MPRTLTCFECGKEYEGRPIIFNMAMVDPYFYKLYHDEPERLLAIFTTCKECGNDERVLERKEW